jgi:hypothetical protein
MVINPHQLLKRLEPSVRPAQVDPAVKSSTAGAMRDGFQSAFETQSFDQMLALVSRGKVPGRPVELGFEMDPAPDEPQTQRLAAAADLAEAAGARNALLLLDGRGLLLDVSRRELTAELSPSANSPIVRLDAAIYVAGGENDPPGVGLTPGRGLPGAGLLPPSIAARFADLTDVAARARAP